MTSISNSQQDTELSNRVSCLSAHYQDGLKALAVFHQGFDMFVLMEVLQVEQEFAEQFVAELEQVGLAAVIDHHYYALHPALTGYLKTLLSDTDYLSYQKRWFIATIELVKILYQQQAENAEVVAELTLLEIPNFLALLIELPRHADAKNTAMIADYIAQLLQDLNQPEALAFAINTREQATRDIGVWNHQAFVQAHATIARLLQQGDLQMAYQQAEALLNQALQAGEQAYPEAAYDLASAYLELGKILNIGGYSEPALTPLQQAQQRFQALANTGLQNAIFMLSVTLSNQADCLTALGQINEAIEHYNQAIELAEQCGDNRSVAANKVQLATLWRKQQDYDAALAEYQAARLLFEQLAEPQSVATLWHQIGIVYRAIQQYEAAEQAYQTAFNIASPLGNQAHITSSLFELANLYHDWGRLEQAVMFYSEVINNCIALNDNFHEGLARSNLANTLIALQRYDQARQELQRAIECKQPFGHNAELWTTWAILHNLELASQNVSAAYTAKQQAIQSYLAYRRAGGQNLNNPDLAQNCLTVLSAIKEKRTHSLLTQLLTAQHNAELSDAFKHLVCKHIAILKGERHPSLADDPELNYDDAAELLLLIEQLN